MTTFLLLHGKHDVSSIAMLVSFKGAKYRKSIGESVQVKHWNNNTKRLRVTSTYPEAAIINDRLEAWKKAADAAVSHFKSFKSLPTQQEFFQYVERERWGNYDINTALLVPYFDVFIERYTGVRSISQIKHYRGCKKTMEEYEEFIGRKLRFDDIDMGFYNSFTAWFYTKGHTQNYLGEKIKILKVVMNDARDIDHLHNNSAHQSKMFSTPQDSTDSVYLTEDELMRIYRLKIDEDTARSVMEPDARELNVQRKLSAMRKARDMFLIGAFTGLRFSDYSRIRRENIKDGVIKIRNKKTGITTSVPVHWMVQEIIDNGYDFEHPLFEQKLNYQIKDIAKLAGIDESVIITKKIGGKLTEQVFKKYELISSHTARRSFATNAYKAGIPTIAIMKITGHKRETTFLRYIRITETENAEMLKSSSFFKDKK